MNFKTFLSALNEVELILLESALVELKTEKEQSKDFLFSYWVYQNKENIPKITYRAFVRNFKTLNIYFCGRRLSEVNSKFIHNFKGIGKVHAFNFLQTFPEFDR